MLGVDAALVTVVFFAVGHGPVARSALYPFVFVGVVLNLCFVAIDLRMFVRVRDGALFPGLATFACLGIYLLVTLLFVGLAIPLGI
jgi:hypothetical protein